MLDKIAEEAKKIVGEGYVVSDPRILEPYLYDKTEPHVRPKPAREVILIKPDSVEEVSEIVKLAFNEGIAVFPRGGGTGLAGGAIPTKPGIILSLERLNRLSIDRENMVADAEGSSKSQRNLGFIFLLIQEMREPKLAV
jgi:glycolate oxidase